MRPEQVQATDDAWKMQTLRGFAARRAFDVRGAAEAWHNAFDATQTLPTHDARRAAAANNAAVAQALLGQRTEALQLLGTADTAWRKTREWIDSCDPPFSGRSSTFHLRLASRNGEAFSNLHRADLLTRCEAGRAITVFNRHVLSGPSCERQARHPEVQACISAVIAAFGTSGAEAEIMWRWPGVTFGQATDATQPKYLAEQWQERPWQTYGETDAIGTAARLTAILDPAVAAQTGSDA